MYDFMKNPDLLYMANEYRKLHNRIDDK